MGRLWRGGALLGVLATLAALRTATADDGSKRVVCYYTNWSVYRPGTAKFSPQNINPYLCTHLIYAFGGLTRENGIRAYDKYQDIEQGGYAKFTGLKTYNKQLKTLLAIGGWNEGSARFSPMVADPERRAEFVKNAVRFLRTNHFDGLDLDWEYPAYRDGGKPGDRDNYAALVQELREEFDRESKKTGRPRLLLTMAVPAGIEYIDKGYDVPRLNKYLDFMNILSYDYHSAFESSVNHHSPLYPLGEDDEYNFEAALSIDYTIKHYLKMGASRDKLVLGIPTYGRSYTLFNPDSTALGAPSDGPGEQGDATREKGYLAYYEICEAEGWQVEKPHPKAMGPYAVKGNQWVGYDDTEIVRLKAEYVNEKGLGGIMFWSIDNDDFRGKCHNRPYPLIEAAKEALLASSGSEKNLVTSKSSKGSKAGSGRAESSTVRIDSAGSGSSTRRTSKLKTKAPSGSTRRTTAVTTPATPTTPSPLTTPEPPSTPDPGSDFVCKDEGFFPHPRDCKKYFWCLDSGPSNLGIVAHQFTCPSGLFFNKAADSCDYARNVICAKKAAAPASTTAATPTTSSSPSPVYGRTTTTTTTTTTTEAPIEEEEEEEVEDEEEDGGQEDPEALKELLNLIKKLGGVEELEKQLRGEKSSSSGSSSAPEAPSSGGSGNSLRNRSLVERVLQGRNRHAATLSTAPASPASSTPRYKSLFRNGPSRPQNDGLQDAAKDTTGSQRERPKYVSIRRERPAAAAEPEEATQNEPEETAVEARTRSRYDRPDRQSQDDADAETEEQDERRPSKPATPEYITLRRNRPSDEPAATTSRYVTLQRSRPSTSTTESSLEEDDEEEADEDDDKEVVAVVTPVPSYREGPVYRPTPLRTTRPDDRVDDEDTAAPTTAPTTTVATASPKVSGERVSLRRPGGFLNHGSRGRRPTTTLAPATTAPPTASGTASTAARRTPVIRRRRPSTTTSPVDSDGAAQTSAPSRESAVNRGQSAAALAQRRRKYRPEAAARTTTIAPEEATGASAELTTERGRYTFLKRGRPRAQTLDDSTSATSPTPTAGSSAEQAASVTEQSVLEATDGEPLHARELNELLARAQHAQQEQEESDLSDLTHPAVVAIHTLATQAAAAPVAASTPSPFVAPAAPIMQSSSFTHVRTGGTSFSTSLSLPAPVPVAVGDAALATASPPAARVARPRQHHTAVSAEGGASGTQQGTTPPPLLEIRVPLAARARGASPRRLPQAQGAQGLHGLGADDVPRLPQGLGHGLGPLAAQLGHLGQIDYEYYDDGADAAPSATKVKIHGDGWIECLDRGNFPHPFSCRKFISCAKMESGDLQGWEYTCPRGLSFDPIGGICNWSAGLGCKA